MPRNAPRQLTRQAPFESVDGLFGNGRAVQQARVVDQRGHRSEPLDGLRHRLLPLPFQCHIQRNPDYRVIARVVDRGAQLGGIDVAGRHEKPVGAQSLGDGPALPAGGPGDQRDTSSHRSPLASLRLTAAPRRSACASDSKVSI